MIAQYSLNTKTRNGPKNAVYSFKCDYILQTCQETEAVDWCDNLGPFIGPGSIATAYSLPRSDTQAILTLRNLARWPTPS